MSAVFSMGENKNKKTTQESRKISKEKDKQTSPSKEELFGRI